MYKVIIVDDEKIIRENLRYRYDWKHHGFEVVAEAENGLQALNVVKEYHPDLIVTDIRMPDMDGLDLLKRAKSISPNIEVIIISAYNDFEYAQRALYYSAAGYMLKPVLKNDFDEMMRKVKSNIESSQSPKEVNVNLSYVERARIFLLENYMKNISLDEVAKKLAVNKSYLSRIFKEETGKSVLDYLIEIRMRHACDMLINTIHSIADISVLTGYEDYTYFCKVFKKEYGCTPLQFRLNSRKR